MVKWTPENNQKLVNIVNAASNVEEGLHNAGEHFETTFYAVRNRWYSDDIKTIRGISFKPKAIRDMEKIAVQYVDAYNVTGTIVEAAKTFLEVCNREVAFLRSKITEVQSENARLKGDTSTWVGKYAALENKYNELHDDFSVVSKILNRARTIANEEIIGLQPEPKRYLIDNSGQVLTTG